MPADTYLKLLAVVAYVCVINTDAHLGSFRVTLPDWRPNADYLAKCDFGSDLPSSCDWTSEGPISTQTATEEKSPSGAFRLKSGPLKITEDWCLEFWYHKPNEKSSDLNVLLVDGILKTLIWTSEGFGVGDWRREFITITKQSDDSNIQVLFEISQGLHDDGKTAFDRMGIHKGRCGLQCQLGTFWTDESTRCTCKDDQLVCSHMPWSNDTFGTCHVASNPHYTTFDGVSFQFESPCTYILSKVCDDSGLLPEFAVEVQNEKKGESHVSSIQQVNVNIYGLRVSMMRAERSKVMVNGIWKHLPFLLKSNRVTVNKQGDALVLQTDFKLSVLYMQSGAIQVIVPIQYSNRICGMCGNFNQDPEDDIKIPNRSQVQMAQVLRQSVCEEPSLPKVCSEAEEQQFSSELYCGMITSRHGPFTTCSSVLNADSFFRSCMFDMCTTHGDAAALCNAIEAFGATCNKVGFSIPVWRNSTFCPVECGLHSHYNACTSGCPQTCSSLDAAGPCGNCEERCECDDGFILSGGECVLEKDCGCWDNGQHYSISETFMVGECEQQCQCLGHDKIQCSPTSCTADELCMVKDGVKGCFPSSPVTCRVYGDPHYITFDGKAYSFWGTCNYTIAKTCGPTDTQFTITARNEGKQNSATSSLNSVALHMEGLHIVIGKNKLVNVNGGQVRLPAQFGSSVSAFESGPYIQLDTNFGLRLLFGNARLFVQVDERYEGELCGLCGTYSGSQFDDFLTPDGTLVAIAHEFASSWNNSDSEWPCSDGSPDPPACHPGLEDDAYTKCSELFEDPFKECHWFVPPQIYVSSCVSDYCMSQGDKAQLCTSLEDYVSACEMAEVFLPQWRNHTLCFANPTVPPTNKPTPTPSSASCTWSCNFDQDECGWEQLIQDSFDWTRWSGSTPSSSTGPTSDHTTGSGFYMYIEGDSVVHGDSARIMSPHCHTSGQQCLSFWFHMYGPAHFMSLNLYKFENNRATKIWSRENNHGNRWIQGQVEIKPQKPFQIIIEGIRGSDPRSDVAIDDVTITYGACDYSSVEDSESTTLEPHLTSPNVIDPFPNCRMSCDFESDICSWTQMVTDVFDWTRHRDSTPTSMTGPSFDHTTGSGFYMYIEGDSALHGDTARLISPQCADPQPQCLQFWYHMYGSSWTMGLSVYLLQYGNVFKEVWKKREDQGHMWHFARVDIKSDVKFQVIFEGRRGSSTWSDVAIDDISLHRGACSDLPNHPDPPTVLPPPPSTTPQPAPIQTAEVPNPTPSCHINCDFEKDICTWTQLATDVFDWTRQRGSTPTPLTGPSSDHTTGSGFYMYIEGDSALHGDTARLLSAQCADPQPQCLQFWYHMYGSSWTMGLTVYLLQYGNVAKEVWSKREDQGNMWHLAQVDLRPDVKFQVIFEGRRGSSARSDVAIDDISLHRGPCSDLPNHVVPPTLPPPPPPTPTTPQPAPIQTTEVPNTSASCHINCDFEKDICTWTQLATDVFDWTRQRGSTPTPLTGPSSDHTTGSGFYMYIEGDSALHGDTARLLSAQCTDPQPQCLQFWYHMYGYSWTMGLSVYLLQYGNVAKEVWRKREDQGNMWHLAQVDLRPDVKFQVIFEGRRGSSARSDVAIDDISLHKGPCSDLPNHVVPPTLPPPPPPTPTTPQPAPIQTTEVPNTSASCHINCDFEKDICTWTQLATDVFDWTRQRGSTPTPLTGPSSDHTTGSGFYMYIEGDSAFHGDTARLLSAQCADPQPQCLQFWYHMYGSSWTMGLSVYLLQYGNVAKEVWRKREDQGNMWHLAQVDLRPDVKFQVIFEGRRGSSARSDVAIDDISLHRGPCSDLPNHVVPPTLPPPPPPTTPQPAPIQTTEVPNTSASCHINCDFEKDICTWTQLATDVFDWTRQRGSTPTPLTGPSSDHTTGSGFYMYIEGDSALHGDTARLLSAQCTDPQPQCLQFWYHMYGYSWTMGLSVYLLQYGNVAQEVWRKREDQGNMWHLAQVDLRPDVKFQVIFEGRRGSSARSDVAIDDISLHKGPCSDLPNHVVPPTLPPPPPLPQTTPQPAPIQTTEVPNASPSCRINCDFEQDICTWTQLATDVFDWTRQRGSTPTPLTGPSSDHKTGSGFYMYIEGDSALHGDTARLLSEQCADPQPQCLQFWYHMYGSSWTMGLSVYLLQYGNVAKEVWRKREDQGNMWHLAQVDLRPDVKFQVIFEGRRGSSARSDVAIDDVSLHRGACSDLPNHVVPPTFIPPPPPTTPQPAPAQTTEVPNALESCHINCDFEKDICTWTQLATDVFDWTRQRGSTPTQLTGPSSDHTTEGGFYMYIEGDSALHGDTARLLSAQCAEPQPQCLQFWYHMYGSSWTMGLSVYLLQYGNVAKEVWRKREDQGNMWHLAQVDLRPDVKFQVIFEGRRGSSARSDVAIDDISLHRGPCSDLPNHVVAPTLPPPPPPTTPQPAPIQTTEVPNASPSCHINCDFEKDICTWTQLATDVFDWTRQRGSTPTPLTGPSSDHTTGSGFYMYIEGDSALHGDTARLLSAQCADPQPQCLQFWYHMYGYSWTMGLSVYLLQYGNVAKEVWRKREDQGNMWHLAQVDLRPDVTFQVIFEGRRGSSARSDVAIDDVSLYRGPCSDLPNHVGAPKLLPPPPGTPPQPSLIQTAVVPNASASCHINCDFENDICAWSQLPTDVFDWTRQRGSTPTPLTGPSSDHTTGSGFYMYIEGDSALHGDTARLLSAQCADPQPQCLQFWYHMYGSSWTMGLTVYLLQYGNVAKEVWGKREDQGNMWHLAQVDLRPEDNFQVIFEGRIGSSAQSDVAIDDISMHRGACSVSTEITASDMYGNSDSENSIIKLKGEKEKNEKNWKAMDENVAASRR
ncbi:MAM and LDL-receptor class A domain-containing protein 1 isoform X1 [Danio aesculapii]|uniref:MAM and LDL-receptor class A domain-containing protein 1 isoform X1 n=1 Tax=Danio aesculapii TaxID=1142201 RepID=UPI0024C07A3B|nr:MAM and LDL-receptor class A domain-containing protein 1 isoform X1 [Danio aesculapii]